MKTITIACKSEDKQFIEEVKKQEGLEIISTETETSAIGVESWIMIIIGVAQLTFQVIDFFRNNVNKNPNRQLVTKEGRFPLNCDSEEELEEQLTSAADEE